MLVFCLYLEKTDFHQFLLSVFKINDTVNFEYNFFVHFNGDQTIILHSKSVILIISCLVLTDSLFSTIFIWWF